MENSSLRTPGTCSSCGDFSPKYICDACVRAAINALDYFNAQRRFYARSAGFRTFPDFCRKCENETPHLVTTALCVPCSRPPIKGDNRVARRVARIHGWATFAGTCETCGPDVDHSVKTGRCLTCFNAMGYRRP